MPGSAVAVAISELSLRLLQTVDGFQGVLSVFN